MDAFRTGNRTGLYRHFWGYTGPPLTRTLNYYIRLFAYSLRGPAQVWDLYIRYAVKKKKRFPILFFPFPILRYAVWRGMYWYRRCGFYFPAVNNFSTGRKHVRPLTSPGRFQRILYTPDSNFFFTATDEFENNVVQVSGSNVRRFAYGVPSLTIIIQRVSARDLPTVIPIITERSGRTEILANNKLCVFKLSA